ncbi:MucB/RseB C-terminal domain-containing protein [Marinobacter bryozoorum]|nr:MucB/RseB C-terminal domain-containing protein [Marinobacter bryozoorum]MCK7544431.1 MucB/RseB C-terminal domain-containing protein [Marinobacter bryozoorum]
MVPGPATARETAESWLLKLGPALNMTTYRGVFVYSRGEQVNSMRIAHRYRDGQVDERLVVQDGANGEIIRRGNRVVCVLPEYGRIQLDQVIPSGPFAEAFASQQVPVGAWYQPELLGEDRIAGYPAVVIGLQPRDKHRYGYRLWMEKGTGLLLKSHVRHSDDVLERFQFTMLEITDQLPDSEFEVNAGVEVKDITPELPMSLEPGGMEGWDLGWRPDGFMPSAAPRGGRGQAVAFSDGLATFSVFVEPAGNPEMPQGASRIGATTLYMHYTEAGETGQERFLVTVVGEIPPKTAMRVARSVTVDDRNALVRALAH